MNPDINSNCESTQRAWGKSTKPTSRPALTAHDQINRKGGPELCLLEKQM